MVSPRAAKDDIKRQTIVHFQTMSLRICQIPCAKGWTSNHPRFDSKSQVDLIVDGRNVHVRTLGAKQELDNNGRSE